MKEEFRDIPNFEGYQVSNFGTVISFKQSKKGRLLKQQKDRYGYIYYCFGKKKMKAHRLVMMAFCPCENMDNLQVSHLDDNKENNCLSNLCWATAKENDNWDSRNEKISENRKNKAGKQVLCIETGVIYPTAAEASRQTGIHRDSISRACRNKQKTAGGFHWQYI